MEKYIGTKLVEAMPMTLGEFIQHSGRNPYSNSDSMHGYDEKGYLVKYKDGYESWSPKDVFEESYNLVEDIESDRHDLQVKFEVAAKPLMDFIRDNYHPHAKAIVTMTDAEILEGTIVYNDPNNVND